MRLTCAVEPDGGALEVQIVVARFKDIYVFRFTGIKGSPQLSATTRETSIQPNTIFDAMQFMEDVGTANDTMSVRGPLGLPNKLLEATPGSPYGIVTPPQDPDFNSQRPFFFQHDQRCYFIEPIPVPWNPITIFNPILLNPGLLEGV